MMVMELLGKSLMDLMPPSPKNVFSVKTGLMLSIEMIRRLKTLHDNNFIHRDVKPDNFAIGVKKNKNRIYIFDMGLSKRYKHRNGEHIEYKEGKDLTGTARYASITTHQGCEQSRRDDLEAAGYVFVYFVRERLPW